MVWRSGLDAGCDYFNATWLAFTGRTLAQELGNGWSEGVHPDDLDSCFAIYLDHFERRNAFEMEYRLRRHDGVYRYVLARGAPYRDAQGAFAGFIGSCTDVDDHKHQAAVSGAVELFEMSLDNLCVAGFDGYFKRVNPSWSRTLGWTTEELMARPSIEFVHPEDREATLAARGRLGAGTPLHGLVNRYLCKDGTYRWFEWRSVSHVDRGLVYATARDVSEQKAAQRVLAQATESLTTTLDSIAEGVIATDADGAVARMNPVAEALTGWTSSDALGKPLEQVFRLVNADAGGAATLVGRDGTELPIASSRAPMRHADGSVSGAVLVFRDMSAEHKAKQVQEQLQRQLILADRLASVGTLAAGVAHEINNPLAYVMANLGLLLEEMQRPLAGSVAGQMAEWVEMLLEARQGSEKIRKIVRGLKTFSRAEEERRAVIDVKPVLELSIDMAFNEIRHRARLVKDYGDIPLVEADDARLGQVFINLLVNAAQALPEGDSVANEIRIVTSTDALGRAVVEVRDTGAGISASVLERIFDPFFTTKAIGVGTGLGLSICHSIVASMGGEISASSVEGRGTTLRVVLPAATGRALAAPVAAVAAVATANVAEVRRAAVLIVDDDRAVAVALGRVLRDHDVTIVTTAREALDLLVADKPFDLVLSDLMMPEMSGMELYDEVARRAPHVAERMVFVTGGAFTPAANAFLDRVPNLRLEKPFNPTVVRALVRKFVS